MSRDRSVRCGAPSVSEVHNLYDEVVVGCTSDEVAEQYKRRPIVCFKDRVKVLEACRYVDRVVEAPLYHAAAFLDKHNIII